MGANSADYVGLGGRRRATVWEGTRFLEHTLRYIQRTKRGQKTGTDGSSELGETNVAAGPSASWKGKSQ